MDCLPDIHIGKSNGLTLSKICTPSLGAVEFSFMHTKKAKSERVIRCLLSTQNMVFVIYNGSRISA